MIIKELLPEYIAKVRQEFGEEGVNRFLELVQETGQQAIDDFLEWRREAEKPKPQEATPCRFGDGPAIARFSLDQGCVAFPDDRVQDAVAGLLSVEGRRLGVKFQGRHQLGQLRIEPDEDPLSQVGRGQFGF